MIELDPRISLTAPSDPRGRLADAATRFEAIFARHMLAAARKAGLGDSLFGGQGEATFRQMLDERFADTLAQRGALGLGKVIEAQLARHVEPDGEG